MHVICTNFPEIFDLTFTIVDVLAVYDARHVFIKIGAFEGTLAYVRYGRLTILFDLQLIFHIF